jgi:hypothetical protein
MLITTPLTLSSTLAQFLESCFMMTRDLEVDLIGDIAFLVIKNMFLLDFYCDIIWLYRSEGLYVDTSYDENNNKD